MGWQTYIKGIKIYIPTNLKKELDILIDDMVFSAMDIVIVIDGKEGTGKSRTARLLYRYISHITNTPFSVDNIHFTTTDYIKHSECGQKFQVNVLDEGRQALNKKRSMARSNVGFTNWLSENRDKRQVHIILLPAIHDLDTYVAMWRMALLINMNKFHVQDKGSMSGWRLVRGQFKLFENGKGLQQVIHNKGKYGHYSYPKNPALRDTFKDCEVFTPEQLEKYETKKSEERAKKYSDAEETESRDKIKLKKMAEYLLNVEGKTRKEIAKIIGCDPSTVSKWNIEKVKSE